MAVHRVYQIRTRHQTKKTQQFNYQIVAQTASSWPRTSTPITRLMLKNYLKVALRNIFRRKAYSIINISGLAIGMASSILILLWVQNELSYDRFHTNAGDIYRITSNAGNFKTAVATAGMTQGFQSSIPVIRNTVRIFN